MKPFPDRASAVLVLFEALDSVSLDDVWEASVGMVPSTEPEERGWWWELIVTTTLGNKNHYKPKLSVFEIKKHFIAGENIWRST